MGNCAGGDIKKDRQEAYFDKAQTVNHKKNQQQLLKKMPCLKPSTSSLISQQPALKKQTSPTSLNFATFYQMIFAMDKQLKQNAFLYKKYLNVSILLEILQYFSKLYVAHEPAVEIINIVLDFMAYCKNKEINSNKLHTSFTVQYLNELSERWIKVRQSVYFYNKDQLKILSFIVSTPKSGLLQYGMSFCDLKFSFEKEQVLNVAKIVKKMCQIDIRSFCFLSNYFYTSCMVMQKQKHPIPRIQNEYLSALSLLGIETNVSQMFSFEDFIIGVFQSHRDQSLFPKIELDLTKFDKAEEKQFALDEFIMQRAMDSMQQFDRFNLLLKQICLKNDGFKYKSGVKIKNKSQTKALTRIKQKMLSTKFEQIELQRQLVSSIRDTFLQNFIDLYSYSSHQFSQFQKKMKSIFSKIDQPIPFKVTDMLRGKCVFSSVTKINNCCADIVKMVESKADEGLRLFEVDNRLKKDTSDLVIKIIIGNVVAEFQLVKEANIADYDFNHKIYELKRSKFFTPLTQLMILNQDLSKDYLLQAKALIMANSIKKGFDYEEKVSFDEPLENFKAFSPLLAVKMNYFETHSNEIDIKMIGLQQKRLRDVLSCKVEIKAQEQQGFQQLLNNGVYYLSMKQYSEAIDHLQQASNRFVLENEDLLQGFQNGLILTHEAKLKFQKYIKIISYLGRTYEQMKNYSEAHKFYFRQLELKQRTSGKQHISIATTLNNIGNVYKMQVNYPKALQTYQKCLHIKENSIRKDDLGIAATLNNIGEVYRSQSNFAKALQYYQMCLSIQEKVKGIESMETAATLNNIGLAYKNQGEFNKALQYFQRCLYLKQKQIGKQSIGYVMTLNNIGNVYQSEGNYPKALQVYSKCLQIQERVKGKDSISIVTTLNNIGLVYSAEGNNSEALQYFERFIQIVERVKGKDSVDIAPALSNIGETYRNQKEYEKGIQYYIQAIRIYQKHNARYKSYAKCLTNLGDAYYKSNEISKAIQSFQSACQTYQKLKLGEQAKQCRIHITKCVRMISDVIKSRDSNQLTNQSRPYFMIKSV